MVFLAHSKVAAVLGADLAFGVTTVAADIQLDSINDNFILQEIRWKNQLAGSNYKKHRSKQSD